MRLVYLLKLHSYYPFAMQVAKIYQWFMMLVGVGASQEDEPRTVSEMSDREIQKEITQAEREMERASSKKENHMEKYKELLVEGAGSDDPGERQVLAIRARFEKFKAKIQELQRLKSLKTLASWTTGQQRSKIEDMLEDLDTDDDTLNQVLNDGRDIQAMIDNIMTDVEADLKSMNQVVSGTDIDLDGLEVQMTEEMALMSEMADPESEVDDEDINVDASMIDFEEGTAGVDESVV